jgi:guanylate kinase
MQGLLFIVAAPSGAGKSSLVNGVLAIDPSLRLSISYTTRPARPGEQHGREYFFVDQPTFRAMLEAGEFLEYAEVHGNLYATSQKQIDDIRRRGDDVVLEIDWQGAQQVRRLYPDAIGIFILPPSLEELSRRLVNRAQDSEETIRRRLAVAAEEISHAVEFDYVIINKDFDIARQDLAAVVRASRLTLSRQCAQHPELFNLKPQEPTQNGSHHR